MVRSIFLCLKGIPAFPTRVYRPMHYAVSSAVPYFHAGNKRVWVGRAVGAYSMLGWLWRKVTFTGESDRAQFGMDPVGPTGFVIKRFYFSNICGT